MVPSATPFYLLIHKGRKATARLRANPLFRAPQLHLEELEGKHTETFRLNRASAPPFEGSICRWGRRKRPALDPKKAAPCKMASVDTQQELEDAAVLAGLANGASASATVERPSSSGSKRKSKVGLPASRGGQRRACELC